MSRIEIVVSPHDHVGTLHYSTEQLALFKFVTVLEKNVQKLAGDLHLTFTCDPRWEKVLSLSQLGLEDDTYWAPFVGSVFQPDFRPFYLHANGFSLTQSEEDFIISAIDTRVRDLFTTEELPLFLAEITYATSPL